MAVTWTKKGGRVGAIDANFAVFVISKKGGIQGVYRGGYIGGQAVPNTVRYMGVKRGQKS